jgi:selenocysteine lyase/cysteine desulfurase
VKSAWVANFEFVGTIDNSPYLCIPAALKWRESVCGGEKAILQYCHQLAKDAAKRTAEMLGTEVMENSTGTLTDCCLSNVRLPLKFEEVANIAAKAGIEEDEVGVLVRNWISKTLVEEYDTFMAVMFYGGGWWVRWSAQVYLELDDFEWGAEKLKELCGKVMKGEFMVLGSKL